MAKKKKKNYNDKTSQVSVGKLCNDLEYKNGFEQKTYDFLLQWNLNVIEMHGKNNFSFQNLHTIYPRIVN